MTENEKPYVMRKDIVLTEEREFIPSASLLHISWEAALYGPVSTGERIVMQRTAEMKDEALQALEQAISELNWEIR